MYKIFITLIIAISSINANAQQIDYTGVWNGKFYDNSSFSLGADQYKFEVQIAQTNKGLDGVTYSYLNTSFYGKASLGGFVKTEGKKIVINEIALLELKSMGGGACLMLCTMKYSKVGEDEYLEGTYTARDDKNGSPCEGGYVKLKKIKKSIFGIEKNVQAKLNAIAKKKVATNPKPLVKPIPKPIVKVIPKPVVKPKPIVKETPKPLPKPIVKATPKPLPTTITPKPKPVVKDTAIVALPPKINTPVVVIKPIPPAPLALELRSTNVVQTINVPDTGFLNIDFYDYGSVDGDIVTIYVNNIKVVDKKMLDVRPITIPIKLDPTTPEVTVTMYADNLGSIPPNTAYMVVRVAGEKYDAVIESTEQKNASVKFVYKPKSN